MITVALIEAITIFIAMFCITVVQIYTHLKRRPTKEEIELAKAIPEHPFIDDCDAYDADDSEDKILGDEFVKLQAEKYGVSDRIIYIRLHQIRKARGDYK